MNYQINQSQSSLKIEELIAGETKRLSEKYNKSFLDCEDLIQITGLGRDNVRALMHSKNFPTIRTGKRQIVGIAAFVAWQFTYGKKEAANG